MFSISVSTSGTFESLDRHEIEIECSRCRLHTWVALGEIRRRDFTVCRGCHCTISLADHMGSVHRAIRGIDDALRSLLEVFD